MVVRDIMQICNVKVFFELAHKCIFAIFFCKNSKIVYTFLLRIKTIIWTLLPIYRLPGEWSNQTLRSVILCRSVSSWVFILSKNLFLLILSNVRFFSLVGENLIITFAPRVISIGTEVCDILQICNGNCIDKACILLIWFYDIRWTTKPYVRVRISLQICSVNLLLQIGLEIYLADLLIISPLLVTYQRVKTGFFQRGMPKVLICLGLVLAWSDT